MRYSLGLVVLLCAACLEVGGDALIRVALRGPTLARTALFFALGGIALTIYGYTVNAPRWDFGQLLGVYVAMVFVVAQVTSWLAFGQKPAPLVLMGGALIMVGGFVVSLAK